MVNNNEYILRANPTPEDAEWRFDNIPLRFLGRNPITTAEGRERRFAKLIIFTPEKISLQVAQLSSNRVVMREDPSKLVIASFEKFRFPEQRPSVATDYMIRMFKSGLFLNGTQYRFFGHGNSQLRGRGCYLREANNDEELDNIIYSLGELKGIMNVAKRAKRIGLLFSGAEVDFLLRPEYVGDIDDLMTGDENFSDGCGLISKRLCVQIARKKRVVFQARNYTPCVYQIRYKGYKGVVMIHPDMDQEKKHLIEFRKSMKKFKSTIDDTFAVVGYSTPYSFGRLNNDIVVLLSSLGITNEVFLAKQEAYFNWIEQATSDVIKGFEFLASQGPKYFEDANRLVLDGFTPDLLRTIRGAQNSELAAFKKNDDLKKERVRMLVHKSRRLYGVCDPHRILREGEVHVRVMTSRNGCSTIIGTDVIVVRNPCLHPGDILKLRAVDKPELSHLVDCVVFASQGKRSPTAMSSGGDLDGDEYFVCWDPDIVPSRVFESYDYPPNKEITQKTITRQDLARYFAAYNSSGMAQTSALHNKWARYHPQGAMSPQCQELNALYSQAVDGAHVKIPERLRKPPEPPEGSRFVLTELFQAAQTWSQGFLVRQGVAESASVSVDEADELIKRLFSVSESTVSEYKLLELARRIARKHDISFRPYLSYINYGALQTHEKYELAQTMEMSLEEEAYMWNSLLRSDIVSPKELTDKKLSGPLRVQRLYSSKDVGIHAFFGYLVRAMQNFTRKLLYCGDGNLQLFNKHRANTFIHIRKPPVNSNEAFITSIALQQISARVQRQMGRINRTPVASVEIHVVSNRDRIAHELFDLRFDHVTTEEFLKRFAHVDKTYLPNTLQDVDLDSLPEPLRVVFAEPANETRVKRLLSMEHITTQVLDQCADFAWIHHADHQLFWIFDTILNLQPMNQGLVLKWLDTQPLLVFCILKKFIADESNSLPAPWTVLGPTIVQHIIRAAHAVPIAALYALEKLKTTVAAIEFHNYLEILELAMISIRAPQQIIETLMVLHECREAVRAESPAKEYAHKQALAVAVDRAQEAADVCPCDEDGKIKRQRSAPAVVPLFAVEGDVFNVVAHIRVDSPTTIRLHSHVRFRAASKPEKGVMDSEILDGLVTLSESGEIRVKLVHRPPPEFERMEWYLYDVGSVATFRAMVDAIRRLALEGPECCRFSRMITDAFPEDDDGDDAGVIEDVAAISAPIDANDLNESQYEAIRRTRQAQVSLIWGPPAVDNVLERFVRLNDSINIVPTDKIIRFATDSFRVGKSVKSFTVESRVGGEIVRDSRRREKAERLIRESTIIFTTCASAGLEPVGLIPLVKGCKKAVLVGDHVQLRPMVRTLGPALLYDVSLFERLYKGPDRVRLSKTMLNVQYRFPEALASFPSGEFYNGELRSDIRGERASEILRSLLDSKFPWPRTDAGEVQPAVFIHCGTEEDLGGQSKSNEGQGILIKHIIQLLSTSQATDNHIPDGDLPSITILSPYTKQTKHLRSILHSSVSVSTIDSFQGRESDIIIFSTVRSNAIRDIGFVEDERRLNVAWTRARKALIVVGDKNTMTASVERWQRAIKSCIEIEIPMPV
ncbi:RdRP-domain-containing protein [Lentinula raphanica]|uniref:RdRP-domain-containing protein n=1 Tax=Lentinula raphanica TaxID=153919 RepID=A0AA38UIH8_9AGAR|nr:RdRP-domain-containing protein [Lentinula raphanica]